MTSPQQPNENMQLDAVEQAIDDVNRINRKIRAALDERMSRAVELERAALVANNPIFKGGALKLDEEAFIGSGHARRKPCNTTRDAQPAHDILGCGMKELKDREQTYDSPGGERSMAKTVAAFDAIHGLGMTEVQGWQFMELLKIVRSSQGEFKLDTFVDGAAYAALAGEAASRV